MTIKNQDKLKAIANKLVSMLSCNGFVIQRYDAYSTDSVYLKLDFGVANSIRISDHEGKKHLQYRYNVIIGCDNNIIEEKYMRYFFNEDSLEALVFQVIFDRNMKLRKYGKGNYRTFMVRNMNEKSDSEGFWKSAIIINDEWRINSDDSFIKFSKDSNGHNEVISDATVTVPQGEDLLAAMFYRNLYGGESYPPSALDIPLFRVGDKVRVSVNQQILSEYYTSFGYSVEQADQIAAFILQNNHLIVTKYTRFHGYNGEMYYELQLGANVMEYISEEFLEEDFNPW